MQEWADTQIVEGKPPLLIALAIAASAQIRHFVELWEISKVTRSRPVTANRIEFWEQMWRDPNVAFQNMLEGALGSDDAAALWFFGIFPNDGNMIDAEKGDVLAELLRPCLEGVTVGESLLQAKEQQREMLAWAYKSLEWNEIPSCDESSMKELDAAMFVINVFWRLRMEDGVDSAELFQRAIVGQRPAVMQVVAVDNSALAIPAIGELFDRYLADAESIDEAELLNKACGKAPKNLKPKRFMAQVAAWCIEFSELCPFSRPFEPHDFHKLYDAIGKERGDVIENELQYLDAFRVMVNRCRKCFPLSMLNIFLQRNVASEMK